MKRREFIAVLGAAAVWPLAVTAQSPSKVYRVGSLNTAAPVADNSPFGAALVRCLAQHGYAVNGNLTAPWRRDASEMPVRLPPGRARLSTNPVPTGSPAEIDTTGRVVPCLAASAEG
jgi:putative ABC transport system substrate-binding protein